MGPGVVSVFTRVFDALWAGTRGCGCRFYFCRHAPGLRNAKLDQTTQISGFWKLKLARCAPIRGLTELHRAEVGIPAVRRKTA
jgi:hypothetical protein